VVAYTPASGGGDGFSRGLGSKILVANLSETRVKVDNCLLGDAGELFATARIYELDALKKVSFKGGVVE
jgi:hypothetical protein